MKASGVCIAFSPIGYDGKKDTEQTVREVRGHNAAYDVVCPKGKEDE